MAHGIEESVKFITGSELSSRWVGAAHGPVNQQRAPHNILPRNESPVPAVQAVIPVVAHDKVIAFRHDELVVHHQFLHLLPPGAGYRHHAHIDGAVGYHRTYIELGELIAIGVVLAKIANVRFVLRCAIYKHPLIYQPDFVPRYADHSLHEVDRRIDGIVKHNNVATAHRPVGDHLIPQPIG